ncbi:hypothetical protein [Sanguibacter sp. 25GB23B1]|uniref:hypothetical protein n=1 Tax=unclassified Sanguibacter TaxID=2645534 RepID=UPI0032B00F50
MSETSEESRRVSFGPRPDESPGRLGLIEAKVISEGAVVDVIEKTKDVLRAVLSMTLDELRSPSTGTARLPEWFVAACSPERPPEAVEQWNVWWRGLDLEARARAEDERSWTLADWLYWMEPDERQWFWWDARIDEDGGGTVLVEVLGWPSPTGALQWLLRAAGASSVHFADTE